MCCSDAGYSMDHQKESPSASLDTGKGEECAPCRALSDILHGMPGMRDHTSRNQHSTGTTSGQSEASAEVYQDCMTCRVVGTTVCGACSAYLAGHLYLVQPASRSHRIGLIAGSALFAGLGVLRAVNWHAQR